MDCNAKIRSAVVLLLVSTMLLPEQTVGQVKDSPQLPIVPGDGTSKDLKLSGPMGVFQLPRRSVKVPKAVRSLLPRGAKVRLLQKLAFDPGGTLVVYDVLDRASSSPFLNIRYPVFLVLREAQVFGKVSLRRRTNNDPDWVFLEAGEIRLSPDLGGIALAFRSMGDGSASLFQVISPEGNKYRTVLKKITGQGRLRADQEANLELWSANYGDECVWCGHYYSIFTYRWNGSRVARVQKNISCRKIDPDLMTDKPIEDVKQSLDGEYSESERKRMQEQHFLRARLPVGLDGVYRGKLGRQDIVMTLGHAMPEHWNSCDFRDPAEGRGRRYPIVATYPDRRNGLDVMLAGMPLSSHKVRLRVYRNNKPTHNMWDLSITRRGAAGVYRRTARHGSKFSTKSTAVSMKRISRDFDPYFSTTGGYDW